MGANKDPAKWGGKKKKVRGGGGEKKKKKVKVYRPTKQARCTGWSRKTKRVVLSLLTLTKQPKESSKTTQCGLPHKADCQKKLKTLKVMRKRRKHTGKKKPMARPVVGRPLTQKQHQPLVSRKTDQQRCAGGKPRHELLFVTRVRNARKLGKDLISPRTRDTCRVRSTARGPCGRDQKGKDPERERPRRLLSENQPQRGKRH